MFSTNTVIGGTEPTSVFTVVAHLALGTVAFRNIGGNEYRVRVQLDQAGTELPRLEDLGWKGPDSEQNRYSTVVNGVDELNDAVSEGLTALAEDALPSADEDSIEPEDSFDPVEDFKAQIAPAVAGLREAVQALADAIA